MDRRDFRSWQEQYFHDPVFHKLVNMLHQLIDQCELTPHEIRQAAMFAAIKHEEKQGYAHRTTNQESR